MPPAPAPTSPDPSQPASARTGPDPALPAPAGPAAPPAHSWHRSFRDLTEEHGFLPLTVEGEIPAGLEGTLFRTGPGRFSAQGMAYRHWFDGDGAVSAVRLRGGAAEGAVRLVQSVDLARERAAGRPLSAGYGTVPPRSPLRRLLNALRPPPPRNTGNTSVLVHRGRLFALNEGGLPTELSPADLTTLGETDLERVVPLTFSAHPHHVPARRAAFNFGVRYGRKTLLDVFVLPDDGAARRIATVPLGGATMIHDFIATPRHLVFFAPPLRLRLLPMLFELASFSENLRWRPELGTEIIVVPIDDPERVLRLAAPPFFQWHFANAFEQGGELVVDYVRHDDFSSNEFLRDMLAGPSARRLDGRLHRARIDLAARRFADEPLWDRPCEFPRVSGASLTAPTRRVYAAAWSDAEAARGQPDQLAAIDPATGRAEAARLGPAQYPSEPVFVRRPDGAEEEGWLLSLVYDGARDRSHLAVLDAARLGAGPLCRAWFSHPVPLTFHGQFARA